MFPFFPTCSPHFISFFPSYELLRGSSMKKGWERAEASGYNDSSQRAQKFKRENDGFWHHFLTSPWSESMPLILLQVPVMCYKYL
jgi:hypothetical protein